MQMLFDRQPVEERPVTAEMQPNMASIQPQQQQQQQQAP